MKKIHHKKWAWVMLIIGFVFAGIQIIKPRVDNPPVTAEIIVPAEVKKILKNACYNCHSNETQLAWFDKITPANWLVAKHIVQGRGVLNFSQWDRYTKDRQKQILFESLNQIEFKLMPLKQYTFLHPEADITAAQIDTIKSYLRTLLVMQVADTIKTNVLDKQFDNWRNGADHSKVVKPNLNGIVFMPGYKDWVAISSTERVDNGTMRIIAGNDVVVNAIKTKRTNPWPDGSAFAKIIWVQVMDSTGEINTGEFKQVDFMIKDKNKYAQTEGWGYARWLKGIELAPYGSNALFTTECVNCHKSMKESDYVFSTPVNISANDGLEGKVISSFINKKYGTAGTLYGNDIATGFARTHEGTSFPAGSALTLVTWIQKEDLHWFGANIPGKIQSVERITIADNGDTKPVPLYEKYGGYPLVKIVSDNKYDRNRINYIMSKRASIMP